MGAIHLKTAIKQMIMTIHTFSNFNKKLLLPISLGTLTALALFTLFAYLNTLNIITCLFIIPFSSGFMTLITSPSLIRQDKLSQICLPWLALLIILFLPSYWRLKVLIILVFPIASLGGYLAHQFIKKLSFNR